MSGEKADAVRVDATVALAADGTPTDIGWGVVRVLPNGTVERTCKGCGAPYDAGTGMVEERALSHSPRCPVFDVFEAVSRVIRP